MKRITAVLCAVALMSCGTTDPDDDDSFTGLFQLRFANHGQYAITAFHLRRAADTSSWGANMLPVDSLRNLEYVWFRNLVSGPVYSFQALFDSSGTVAMLTHDSMWTGGSDTISSFAGLSDDGWGIGYNWGLDTLAGEVDVTP